ncbi:hypothetical protein LTR53_015936 [Teratosphaeriaceae sp. CCFEE 6253]|nr:hypothetical protein LTR53_015936 [Teratosphaeriaceae sp. CCFEE 6253]
MLLPPSAVAGTLKAFSLFAIATGTLDILLGTAMAGTPAESPATSPTMRLIDSQLRFLGAMWAGYGLMLWWITDDLPGRRTPLALLSGVMVAGGVGRAISGARYGFSATWVAVAMWVELLGPAGLYLLAR